MKLAFKEIKYNWKKYLMVEFLVVLLIFMVIFLTGLANGLGKALSSGIENLNTQGLVMNLDAEKMIGMSRITELDANKIMEIDNTTTPIIIQHSQIKSDLNAEKNDITYFAIEPSQKLLPEVASGESLSGVKNTALVDNALQSAGFKVGDKMFDSETELELEKVGFVDNQSYSHTPIVFISLETYEEILKTVNPNAELRYNAIATDNLETSIEGYEVVKKQVAVESMPGYLAEQLTIQMIIWVLVIVSASILAVFFYILTLQKIKQIGVMKAIGFSVGVIAKIQFIQIASIASFGAVLALVSALGLGALMPSSMPFFIDYKEIAFVTIAFVVIAVVSSMVSMINISKVDANSIIGGGEV